MKNNKIHINEATTTNTGGRGSYIAPLEPGLRPFKKDSLAPFTDSVSDYDSPLLQYDSYDGKMDERRKQIKQIEKVASKVTNYIKRHPYSTFSDDDGNNINQFPKGKNKKGIVPVKEWVEVNDDLIIENLFKRSNPMTTSTPNKKPSQNESFEGRVKNYLLEFINKR